MGGWKKKRGAKQRSTRTNEITPMAIWHIQNCCQPQQALIVSEVEGIEFLLAIVLYTFIEKSPFWLPKRAKCRLLSMTRRALTL